MALRIVLDFDEEGILAGAGAGGWSEVAWLGTGSIDGYLQLDPAGVPIVGSPFQLLMAARLNMLAQAYRISHVRVTDTNPANGERSVDLPTAIGNGRWITAGGNGLIPGVPGRSAEVFAKLLLRMESGPLRRRNWWLGGVPEEIVHAPTTYAPTQRWNDKLGAFGQLLTTAGYGILGRPLRSAATPIGNFGTFDALGQTAQIQPVPPGVPAAGTFFYVVLRGMRSPRGWNGVHLALQPSAAATYIVIGPTRRSQVTTPAFTPNARSTVQVLVPVFAVTDRIRPVRISRRKVGAPFGLGRGRSPG